jgi:transposase
MSWRPGQAYAQHLRDRVRAVIDRGMGAYEVAPLLQVSVSWINKALARRRETGESTARPQLRRSQGDAKPKVRAHNFWAGRTAGYNLANVKSLYPRYPQLCPPNL